METAARQTLSEYLDKLAAEIELAGPGSDSGQFPILDLLGNIRDCSPTEPGGNQLHLAASQAAQAMATLLESQRAFTTADLDWLRRVCPQLRKLLEQPDSTFDPSSISAPAAAINPPPHPPPLKKPASTPAFPRQQSPITLDLGSDCEVLRSFAAEAHDHCRDIESALHQLEKTPHHIEPLNSIFRAFHTIKGAAGYLNLTPISQLSHSLEFLIEEVREQRIGITTETLRLIDEGRNLLDQWIREIQFQLDGTKTPTPIFIPILPLLKAIRSRLRQRPGKTPLAGAATATRPQPHHPGPTAAAPSARHPSSPRETSAAPVKVDRQKLDDLLDLLGELSFIHAGIQPDRSSRAARVRGPGHPIRDIPHDLRNVAASLTQMPMRAVFERLGRVIRDLAEKSGKQLHLATHGSAATIDRRMFEPLNDVLLHMIRNSVDHGIETPDIRQAAGKPAHGVIDLRAKARAGTVIIEVRDDGAGLNPEKILSRAAALNLIPAGSQLSERQIFNLIFEPGFSTAEKVTALSGRGVGMDVVKHNLERLGGSIDIQSRIGRGVTFTITLPLPLGIFSYLILDSKSDPSNDGGKTVLMAVGLDHVRKRVTLDSQTSTGETRRDWLRFLIHLRNRGLRGVQFITHPCRKGLISALKSRFPKALRQQCQTETERQTVRWVSSTADKKRVSSQLRSVFNAPTHAVALQRLDRLIRRYRTQHPAFAAWLRKNIPPSLVVFTLPPALRWMLGTIHAKR